MVHLLSTSLLVDVGQATLPAVVAVEVVCHESSGTAFRSRALLTQALYLSTVINLIILEDG
ncbi:hypothetical protein Mapa_011803 [Marchantia paleacea]|nr:hypothetical protein Mapa_011803 [Marchantia paleacea]